MWISKFDTAGIEETLTALQTRYELVRPGEYCAFLRKYNGGETPETSFRLAGVSSDLRGFFGLGISAGAFALERRFDCGELSALVSGGLFPIGKNAFGDLLFIRTKGTRPGEILFQYHDRGNPPVKLADSLQDFIARCKSKQRKPCRSIEERIAGRRAAGILAPPPAAALQEWLLTKPPPVLSPLPGPPRFPCPPQVRQIPPSPVAPPPASPRRAAPPAPPPPGSSRRLTPPAAATRW